MNTPAPDMPDQRPPAIPLLDASNGQRVRVCDIAGGNLMIRRMLSLGIRSGSIIEVLNHRGKGVVVGKAGTRVALGADIAGKLLVEPLDQ